MQEWYAFAAAPAMAGPTERQRLCPGKIESVPISARNAHRLIEEDAERSLHVRAAPTAVNGSWTGATDELDTSIDNSVHEVYVRENPVKKTAKKLALHRDTLRSLLP